MCIKQMAGVTGQDAMGLALGDASALPGSALPQLLGAAPDPEDTEAMPPGLPGVSARSVLHIAQSVSRQGDPQLSPVDLKSSGAEAGEDSSVLGRRLFEGPLAVGAVPAVGGGPSINSGRSESAACLPLRTHQHPRTAEAPISIQPSIPCAPGGSGEDGGLQQAAANHFPLPARPPESWEQAARSLAFISASLLASAPGVPGTRRERVRKAALEFLRALESATANTRGPGALGMALPSISQLVPQADNPAGDALGLESEGQGESQDSASGRPPHGIENREEQGELEVGSREPLNARSTGPKTTTDVVDPGSPTRDLQRRSSGIQTKMGPAAMASKCGAAEHSVDTPQVTPDGQVPASAPTIAIQSSKRSRPWLLEESSSRSRSARQSSPMAQRNRISLDELSENKVDNSGARVEDNAGKVKDTH